MSRGERRGMRGWVYALPLITCEETGRERVGIHLSIEDLNREADRGE
jgi:hypothetical protein